MNFFLRNRVIIWILGGLLIITLSILGSMIYHTWTESEPEPESKEFASEPGCGSSCQMLFGELELDEAQQEQMEQILNNHHDSSSALIFELRQRRMALMEELRSDSPDTAYIMLLSKSLGETQTRMTSLAARQYLQIRSICTPEQQHALSNVYCDLFGCPRIAHEETQNQHRHRYGKK